MRAFVVAALLSAIATPALAGPQVTGFVAEWPTIRLYEGATGVTGVKLRAVDAQGDTVKSFNQPVAIRGLALTSSITAKAGVIKVPKTKVLATTLIAKAPGVESRIEVPTLAGYWSLLPALFAIGLALATRQVLLSLLGGVWLGATLLFSNAITAVPRSLDIIARVAADGDKVKIMVFTLLMGGMVGVISASGGTAGIVALVVKYAKSARSAALATWGMGMLVFFDDYASSLLVGSTMRPVGDRFKLSREKLSYIVDSTAAPIASLAIVSTWVGYEVSVLASALKASNIQRDAYEVFLNGVPSRFYQLFALVFVLIIALLGRDFGPMLKAERRARHEGKPIRDGGEPLMDTGLMEEADELKNVTPRWWLALIPIATLIFTVLIHLWTTGSDAGLSDPKGFAAAKSAGFFRWFGYILSNAASYDALLYGSGFAAAAAMVLAVGARALNLKQSVDALVRGVRAMTMAIMVLILAWSIGKVMDDLRAGPYVASLLADSLPAWTLPSLTFLLAGLIALATGTSWGTMAILFPIVIPVVAIHQGTPQFDSLLLGASSAILGGAVFGDHCSPISDTTVLSSIACASDHVDHTRTQAPYALVCAAVSIFLGYIPLGLGMNPWISVVIGLVVLVLVARFVGKHPEET